MCGTLGPKADVSAFRNVALAGQGLNTGVSRCSCPGKFPGPPEKCGSQSPSLLVIKRRADPILLSKQQAHEAGTSQVCWCEVPSTHPS